MDQDLHVVPESDSHYGGFSSYRPRPRRAVPKSLQNQAQIYQISEEQAKQRQAEGWYSPVQRYSDPKIPYVPLADSPVFAICQFDGFHVGVGSIQLAQLPRKATIYQIGITAPDTFYDEIQEYEVTIREKGRLGDKNTTCEAFGGEEFNPLKEVNSYGVPNPFQDPTRGKIANIITEENGDISKTPDFVLQNLVGPDSILGRQISVRNTATNNIDCCVIAVDETPERFRAPETFPSQIHPTEKPGYGAH